MSWNSFLIHAIEGQWPKESRNGRLSMVTMIQPCSWDIRISELKLEMIVWVLAGRNKILATALQLPHKDRGYYQTPLRKPTIHREWESRYFYARGGLGHGTSEFRTRTWPRATMTVHLINERLSYECGLVISAKRFITKYIHFIPFIRESKFR